MYRCGDVCGCWVYLTWQVSVCVVVCVGVSMNLGQQLSTCRKEGKERKGGRKVEVGDLPLSRPEQTLNCCPVGSRPLLAPFLIFLESSENMV